MQYPGTGLIRTLIPPAKPKQETTKITNSHTKRSLLQREHKVNRVGSSFPKGGHSATQSATQKELKLI